MGGLIFGWDLNLPGQTQSQTYIPNMDEINHLWLFIKMGNVKNNRPRLSLSPFIPGQQLFQVGRVSPGAGTFQQMAPIYSAATMLVYFFRRWYTGSIAHSASAWHFIIGTNIQRATMPWTPKKNTRTRYHTAPIYQWQHSNGIFTLLGANIPQDSVVP